MTAKPTAKEIKRRQKRLAELVAEHGRTKVCFAAMMSDDGLRMCASKSAPRNIAPERLLFIEYRLADNTVWDTPAWRRVKKRLDAEMKAKESGMKP